MWCKSDCMPLHKFRKMKKKSYKNVLTQAGHDWSCINCSSVRFYNPISHKRFGQNKLSKALQAWHIPLDKVTLNPIFSRKCWVRRSLDSWQWRIGNKYKSLILQTGNHYYMYICIYSKHREMVENSSYRMDIYTTTTVK